MFLNTPVLVNKYERDYIENHVKGRPFTWHHLPNQINPELVDPRLASIGSTNTPFFNHILMSLSEEEGKPGNVLAENIQDYNFFETIFLRWCNNNINTPKIIYRACLNCTKSSFGEFTIPHVDHKFPHNVWIMYLNDAVDAPTVFFDDEWNIVKSAEARAYTCVAFSQHPHGHIYAKGTDYRIVVVFTWI